MQAALAGPREGKAPAIAAFKSLLVAIEMAQTGHTLWLVHQELHHAR